MNRREFLQVALASATSVSAGCADEAPLTPSAQTVATVPPQTYFPQSIVSGDPRPDSVILWTRLSDSDAGETDLSFRLEVATDQAFEELVPLDDSTALPLVAEARWDHCVKVRVAGLRAETTYYYRFSYDSREGLCRSRVGRTRTAPAQDSDSEVRFAFVTCQDKTEGQFYNVYRRLLEVHGDDLHFVVHLGDYIYEKATPANWSEGDPPIVLSDEAGAIRLNEGDDNETLAARSIDNYRELYRQYRSDPWLQRVHEQYPFIQLWDDHEFANDCWGINGTDLAGRQSEADEERRKNANQAWFEYQPIDFQDPEFRYDPAVAHPDDIRVYRDFIFGQHLHLVVTDLRSYRADHPVPEDALPGAVAVIQEAAVDYFGDLPEDTQPYVDIDAFEGGRLAQPLRDHAPDGGYDASKIQGLISVAWVNDVVANLDDVEPIADVQGLARGYAFSQINKTSPYTSLGARNLVVRGPYEAYCARLYEATEGLSEQVFGPQQRQWFFDTLKESNRTFKVWANEYCLNAMAINLTSYASLPDSFRKEFYVLCDDWTAFPNRKAEVLGTLAEIGDVVAITGDVHAFFAATPYVPEHTAKRVVELVTSSVSSATIRTEMIRIASSDPDLKAAGAPALAFAADALLNDPDTVPNPQMAFNRLDANGFSVLSVDAERIQATMHMIDEVHHFEDLSEDLNFAEKWESTSFRVDRGAPDLYSSDEGKEQRWDVEAAQWIDV